MSYRFMVMPDIEEGWNLKPEQIGYAHNEDHLPEVIRNVSNNNPQATICIYEIKKQMRIRKRPEYQEYTFKDGEFIPS